MLVCACSDVGKVRETNQDALYYIEYDEFSIYIIADGMGGHSFGDYASNLTIHIARKLCNEHREAISKNTMEIPKFINLVFKTANQKILSESIEKGNSEKMGTTLTLLLIKDGEAYIGHIGDSRAYILKNNEMAKITHDHSLVEELIKSGIITEEEAFNHPKRNIITKALGIDESISPDIYSRTLEKDDMILMCTDGLTGVLRENIIKDRVVDSIDKESVCTELINEVNSLGGPDNITVLLIKII